MQKEHFSVTGMTCSACSARVEKAVSKLSGTNEVAVNLLKNSMVVSFDENILSSADIISAVQRAGYSAFVQGKQKPSPSSADIKQDNSAQQEYMRMKQRLIISIIFAVPLFYISMGHMLGAPLPAWLTGTANALPYAFTQFLLLLPIIFVNFRYYSVGYKTLFHLSPNMDSLIAIGSSAAVIYGIYAIYKIGFAFGMNDLATVEHFSMDLYFESAGTILTLITLGKFFESRAKGKTSDAITKLMNLAPKTAIRITNGTEEEILVDNVQLNDILVVKAGKTVPVDGIIIEGKGMIDEAALTGEPLPMEKELNMPVIGGTINKSGYFKMRVTKVGADTTLAQIVSLVDEATSSKAPIAKIADKVSGIFVPVVITIAVLTSIGWYVSGYSLEFALSIGICVLVISCPCALGLATPTAIMVGTGKGAGNGILLKSAEALETAHGIDTVVLDKTGTITQGKPVVTDIILFNEATVTDLLQIAASLEKLSEHPLAEAILNEADKRKINTLPVQKFMQIAGQGLTGEIDGKIYLAGNSRLLSSYNLLTEEIVKISEKFATEGKTPLFFASDKKILGIIAVADVIKATSPQAVAELKNMNIDVIMLTGDNAKTAQHIGSQVGINHIISEVLPQDKEQKVRQLQTEGRKVAMVGDGINDAPALARADVGIAIGAGTDIAVDSADIVLMKSDLLDVSTAIKLSKAVIKNIKQNLFWAFIYNIIGIPVAMGLFYTSFGLKLNPMIGALAMSFSSVFVVSNALRLRFFRPSPHNPPAVKQFTTNSAEINIVSVNINTKSKGDVSMGLLGNILHKHSGTKKIISIEGMMCQHCVKHATEALQKVSGVTNVEVSLENKNAVVYVNDSVTDDMLKNAIVEAGYEVTSIN